MKYIYIFFIALTSFGYGQYTPTTSSLFNNGAAAYPRNITAAYMTDGNTGQAQTLSFNVTSLPDGDPKFRVYKTTANGSDNFGQPQAITIGENTFTVQSVAFTRVVKFQFNPAGSNVEFDQISINGIELLGNVDFKTGYAPGLLNNNPNWKAATTDGFNVDNSGLGSVSCEGKFKKAVMGQKFNLSGEGDSLTYKVDFNFNSDIGELNKILMRFGFTTVNAQNTAPANENVVHLSINNWNGHLALRNDANQGGAASGFQNVSLPPASVNGKDLSVEMTLSLGPDAANSSVSAKLISSDGTETALGTYSGVEEELYTAAIDPNSGIYAMFNTAAIHEGGADGGPIVGGITITNLNISAPAAADTEPPVITLVGENPVNISVGDVYTDAGATAQDDIDGDISSLIIVGGDTVDTSTVGTYNITYNVSDSAGNAAAEVTRTVNVNEPTYNITFTVDMTNVDGYDGTTPISLAGSFAAWDLNSSHTMTDNSDGTHSVTIPLQDGNYTYKYLIGNTFDGQENIAENSVCSVRSGTYVNRKLIVNGSDATHANPYNGCSGTGETYDLKFVLDMTGSGVTVNDNLYLSGGFNGFNDSTAFTESETTGVYEVYTSIAEGTYTWKARMGNWSAQESFNNANDNWEVHVKDPHAGIVTNDVYTDRVLTIDRDMTVSIIWSDPTPTISEYEAEPVSASLSLQGIMDLTVPTGGSGGKAIHLVATADISDMSVYGIGSASNGGGTDGQEYTFPSISVTSGMHILLAREKSAMDAYMDASNIFDLVIESNSEPTGNGNDAYELFFNGDVIETYGDIDGATDDWEYVDSWSYKGTDGTWSIPDENCSDNSTTTWDSDCVYPFAIGKEPIAPLDPVVTFEDDGILSATELVIGSLATGAIVDNPDGAGKVLQVTYGDPSGWDNHAGYELPPGNATMIGGTIQFKLKSDHGADAGTKGYMLKLEGGPNGTIEKAFAVAGDNSWEFISVDLSDCNVGRENGGNCGGQENSGDGFTKLLIFHWGAGADAPAGNTFYIDDVAYDVGPIIPEPLTPITEYSENFDDGDSGWAAADGGAFVEDTQLGWGVASNTNAQDWTHIYYDSAPLDLSSGDRGFRFKIRGPRTSKVFFKLQVGGEYWNNHEWPAAEANYTTPGEWQTILVDASMHTSNDKTRIVIFFDTQTAASADASLDIFEIDDFEFGSFATLDNDNNHLLNSLSFYPNPTIGLVKIQGGDKLSNVKVYSIDGQLIKKANNTNSIDLSYLRNGIYIIEIKNEGKTLISKIIKR